MKILQLQAMLQWKDLSLLSAYCMRQYSLYILKGEILRYLSCLYAKINVLLFDVELHHPKEMFPCCFPLCCSSLGTDMKETTENVNLGESIWTGTNAPGTKMMPNSQWCYFLSNGVNKTVRNVII